MKLRHIMLVTAIVFSPAAAFAQDSANIEGRVKKLEKEVRAVQRVVFPGGAGKYFEPEIKPEGTSKQSGGTNSNAAAAGLNSRIDSLEAQLAELTGQVEQQGNKLRTMETRLKALEAGIKTADVAPATTTATTKPAATSTMSARAKEVAAVEKPSTGDAFEDNYNYTPTTFTNGEIKNKAGENNGSCKLFAFAKLQKLTKEETLYCFGEHYKSVLEDVNGNAHLNIRNFMKTGFNGLYFENEALTLR